MPKTDFEEALVQLAGTDWICPETLIGSERKVIADEITRLRAQHAAMQARVDRALIELRRDCDSALAAIRAIAVLVDDKRGMLDLGVEGYEVT